MAGLAGVGDIVLTCTGDLSRNRTVGEHRAPPFAEPSQCGSLVACTVGPMDKRRKPARHCAQCHEAARYALHADDCPPPTHSQQRAPAFPAPAPAGMRIGQGEKLSEIMKTMTAVAEGVLTSKSAHDLAQAKGIDCPVISGIYKVRSWLAGWVCVEARGRWAWHESKPAPVLGSWSGAAADRERRTMRCALPPLILLLLLPLLQVIHLGADPVQVMVENMSRPLKPEVRLLASESCTHWQQGTRAQALAAG